MAKKDAVSKRLAEEIAFAKRINDRIKDPPSLSMLDLANPDEKEKLAASLWLDEKDPLLVAPILEAFKALAWTIEALATGTGWRPTWRASFSLGADPVRRRNGPKSGYACCSRT
jgi:hypothetical protein